MQNEAPGWAVAPHETHEGPVTAAPHSAQNLPAASEPHWGHFLERLVFSAISFPRALLSLLIPLSALRGP